MRSTSLFIMVLVLCTSLSGAATQQLATQDLPLAHDHIALRYRDDAKEQFMYEPGAVQLMIGSSSKDIRLRGHVDLVSSMRID